MGLRVKRFARVGHKATIHLPSGEMSKGGYIEVCRPSGGDNTEIYDEWWWMLDEAEKPALKGPLQLEWDSKEKDILTSHLE